MTPDGKPIVGFDREVEGFFHAIGMCGRSLMLGPGLADIIAQAIAEGQEDEEVFADLSPTATLAVRNCLNKTKMR